MDIRSFPPPACKTAARGRTEGGGAFCSCLFYFFQDPSFPFLPKEKRIAADEKKEKEGRNLLLFFLARIYEQFPK